MVQAVSGGHDAAGGKLDPRMRGFQVKAVIDDPEKLLKPGMFARVRVIVSRRENRPAVPVQALVEDERIEDLLEDLKSFRDEKSSHAHLRAAVIPVENIL